MTQTLSTTTHSLLDLTLAQLGEAILTLGQPAYRAEQIYTWIYRRGARSFEEMTDLPAPLRAELTQHFRLSFPEAVETGEDKEAERLLLRLQDGQFVESVRIKSGESGTTFCLSTQIGCALACRFCASGQLAFRRNLSAGEIVGQVLTLEKLFGRPAHLVYMGMGEPFHNYEATLQSLAILQEQKGYQFGARRITVSTVGVVPEIYRFAREETQVNLAISLHATTDAKRMEIMPIARVYHLNQLLDAAWEYVRKTGRRVSFEYVLLRGVNDTHHDADRLIEMLRGRLAHINLIPFNPIPMARYQRPSRKEVERFADYLRAGGVNATIRHSAGSRVAAACGQLAGRRQQNKEGSAS